MKSELLSTDEQSRRRWAARLFVVSACLGFAVLTGKYPGLAWPFGFCAGITWGNIVWWDLIRDPKLCELNRMPENVT